VPAEGKAEDDAFTRKYFFVVKDDGRPLIMHVADVRLLKLLTVGKIYNVTFQETL
jgi:hypothetical protein